MNLYLEEGLSKKESERNSNFGGLLASKREEFRAGLDIFFLHLAYLT